MPDKFFFLNFRDSLVDILQNGTSLTLPKLECEIISSLKIPAVSATGNYSCLFTYTGYTVQKSKYVQVFDCMFKL